MCFHSSTQSGTPLLDMLHLTWDEPSPIFFCISLQGYLQDNCSTKQIQLVTTFHSTEQRYMEIKVRENRRGNQEWANQTHLARLGTQDTGRRETIQRKATHRI